MKVSNYEIDIQTLLFRISENELNLQPSFQRGEIWSLAKKKKLIDTIFRGWRMPPIHILESDLYTEEVLDGQQRLAAIRDFYNNEFTFDGFIEPSNPDLKSLDNKIFHDLPKEYQRLFLRHTIAVNKLSDFKNEEPAELFFRLNQPSALSPSELRNAYIGIPRNQIKKLVDLFIERGADVSTIGFSNTRLAYDDIISRVCTTIENKSMNTKVTSKDISDRYRKDIPFSENTVEMVQDIINKYFDILSIIGSKFSSFNPKLNKATLYTWLLVFWKHRFLNPKNDNHDATLFYSFESSRVNLSNENNDKHSDLIKELFDRYNTKASFSTNDIKSVIERDFFIELFDYISNQNGSRDPKMLSPEILKLLESNIPLDTYMISEFNHKEWGDFSLW